MQQDLPPPFKPDKETKKLILEWLKSISTLNSALSDQRARMETIDRYYYREYLHWKKSHRLARTGALKQNNASPESDFLIEDVEVPQVFKLTETATAFYSQLFLSQYPIFSPVAQPNYTTVNESIESIFIDHQEKGKWHGNLIKTLRDLVKYPAAGLEVAWDSVETLTPEFDPISGTKLSTTQWQGNRIRAKNSYNIFWDTRVDPSEIPEAGEYAGFSEIWSYVRLKQEYLKLDKDTLEPIDSYIANSGKSLGVFDNNLDYFIPNINTSVPHDDAFTWAKFFHNSTGSESNKLKFGGVAKTYYVRIIPKELGMKVPQSGRPQIWKFVVFGNLLFSVRKMTNAHDWLPMVIGQLHSDSTGYQAKTFAENAMPYQSSASALLAARINSSRRAIVDRAIYNPYYLSDAQVNNPSPTAKLKIRNHTYATSLDQIYRAIPYEDRAAVQYLQDVQVLSAMGDEASGINQALQGQFVRGNKSLSEFNSIMGNASARLELGAIYLDSHTFGPIKEILKSNILQFQPDVIIWNAKAQQTVSVSMAEIRQSGFGYKLTSGLNPATKVVGMDFIRDFMQMAAQAPQLQGRADLWKVLTYLISLGTNVDLSQFELPPPPPQAVPQQPEGNPNDPATPPAPQA